VWRENIAGSPILPISLATQGTLLASAVLWRDVLCACLWQSCAAIGKILRGSNDALSSQPCLCDTEVGGIA
jgi:hypothetical protein